jgi:hypothetical protein
MAKKEFELLQESYEEVKIQKYIDDLISEGKSEKEIEQILSEAGLLTRLKGKFQEYGGRGGWENLKSSLQGKAARGLAKTREFFGQDVEDPEYTETGMEARRAESEMRGRRLESIVSDHRRDLEKLIGKMEKTKEDFIYNANTLAKEIAKDYFKTGGLSKNSVNKMKVSIQETIIDLFKSTFYDERSPHDISRDLMNQIIEIINKEKTDSKKGMGLRASDKIRRRY